MSLQFSREQVEMLNHAQATSLVMQRRLDALRLLGQGYQVRVVAQRLGIRQKSVYQWFHIFQQQGVQALMGRLHPDRLGAISDGYRRCLEQTLAVPNRRWSVEQLSLHLYQQTGRRRNTQNLVNLLKAMGYAYRRVECWEQDELVFASSTWVKAAPRRSRSDPVLIFTVEADGSISAPTNELGSPHKLETANSSV